ncbi:MAG: helix-turn-helix domain-containing GNAT family N-acetyltransferase [Proteobacteria bacterium]|nr:helix-turn-helix domain-containing GNAT family N-acetyltransferase [Pseudomonadota bacterium]
MNIDEIAAKVRVLGREMVRELGVVDSASSPCNVSLTQCHVLIELERNGTLTANELAELLIVDKSAISRTASQLIELGLINLRVDTADQRRKPMALTALGTKRAAEIHRSANGRVQEALSILDPDELQLVTRGMSLYVKALHRARLQKGFAIRPSLKADNPDVTRLIRGVLAEFGGCPEGDLNDALELSDIQKAYSAVNTKFYVIEHNGRIVGCSGVRPLSRPTGISTCELRRMYFFPEARGLGLGRLLLKRCLEDAEHLGYRRCYLETKSNMIHAQKLYERFGFIRTNESLSATKNGCDVFYTKELAPDFNVRHSNRRLSPERSSKL